MSDFAALQNGSDVRGVAADLDAKEPVTLTPRRVSLIAAAFGQWLKDTRGKAASVAVGHDSRISAATLKAAAARGLGLVGVAVIDCGLASTPAMFMSTVLPQHSYDGAIMLTASHLPANRNGLKFFTRDGGLESKDIADLLKRAAHLDTTTTDDALNAATAQTVASDLMRDYSAHLVSMVRQGSGRDKPLDGFKIIVDAGNGAGGFFVSQVLQPLGADTTGSQFLEPDGMFPNHVPNPEDHAAMKACSEATMRSKADLGIIFDTDVDRAAVVDSSGIEINRDRLIALLAKIVLDEHPGSTIVTDSVTSNGLAAFIAGLGGVHHRFKRGYKNVINEGIRLNSIGQECHLAIETSGHGAIKENYFLDDGAFLIVKILVQVAKLGKESPLANLIKSLREPAEDEEFRFKIKDKAQFVAIGTQAIEALRAFASSHPGWSIVPNNFEGVRVACDASSGDGWLLLRLSLHDPVLPLNIQSDTVGGAVQIADVLENLFRANDALDISALQSYLAKHRKA